MLIYSLEPCLANEPPPSDDFQWYGNKNHVVDESIHGLMDGGGQMQAYSLSAYRFALLRQPGVLRFYTWTIVSPQRAYRIGNGVDAHQRLPSSSLLFQRQSSHHVLREQGVGYLRAKPQGNKAH